MSGLHSFLLEALERASASTTDSSCPILLDHRYGVSLACQLDVGGA